MTDEIKEPLEIQSEVPAEVQDEVRVENAEIGVGLQEELGVFEKAFEPVAEEPALAAAEVEAAMVNELGLIEEEEAEVSSKILLDDTEGKSILESLFFATSHPLSISVLRAVFRGTNVNTERLRGLIDKLQTDYAGGERGITLEEVANGYQLRTKLDNASWIKKLVKTRPFKLSGPALEVLSIVAYKQPCVKGEIDQIRGVESGHLMRALMEKNLVRFAGKSELPGKPMLYGTTKDFLELFGLRNIRELPSLSEIDELIPEGIGEVQEITGLENETLSSLAEKTGLAMGKSYSDSESELLTITEELGTISTSTEFFEQEKLRQRDQRDRDRAQDLRERMVMGEMLSEEDTKWLIRYEAKIQAAIDLQKANDISKALSELSSAPVPAAEKVLESPFDASAVTVLEEPQMEPPQVEV